MNHKKTTNQPTNQPTRSSPPPISQWLLDGLEICSRSACDSLSQMVGRALIAGLLDKGKRALQQAGGDAQGLCTTALGIGEGLEPAARTLQQTSRSLSQSRELLAKAKDVVDVIAKHCECVHGVRCFAYFLVSLPLL